MKIEIIKEEVNLQEVERLAQESYGDMVKGVADLKREIIALGGELHADAEALLIEQGSNQEDLWGFNIYPKKDKDRRFEFTSFINIRPSQNNRSMEVEDPRLREKIRKIVDKLVK